MSDINAQRQEKLRSKLNCEKLRKMESSRKISSKSDPLNEETISKMKASLSFDESLIETAWKRLNDKLDIELKVFVFMSFAEKLFSWNLNFFMKL